MTELNGIGFVNYFDKISYCFMGSSDTPEIIFTQEENQQKIVNQAMFNLLIKKEKMATDNQKMLVALKSAVFGVLNTKRRLERYAVEKQ